MKLKLSEQVKRVIKAEKISDDELEQMVKLSAPFTGEGVNRRYHQWLFKVTNDPGVEKMMLHDLRTVGTTKGQGWIEEEHEACLGEGCRDCGWTGVVRRYL
jgi:hypothetical protein